MTRARVGDVVAATSLALLLAFASAAAAQEPVGATLGVNEAVAYARRHSPAYRQVVNDVEAADANTRAAWAGFLPQLSLSARTGGSSSTVVTGQDDAGRPITLADPLDFQSSSSSQSVSANVTLFEGGRHFHDLAGARSRETAAEASLLAEGLKLDANVRSLYWQAVQAGRAIAVEEALLAAANEQKESIQRRVRVAAAGPEDVLGADVDVATRELSLEQARGAARKAVLSLLEAMGAPLDVEPALDSEPPATVDPASLDVDVLVEAATGTHPDVAAARARVSAAEASLRGARAGYWPTISADAGYGRSTSLSTYDALFEPNPRNHAFSFGLSVSLPIFTGFQTSAQVAQSSAALDDARAQLRAAKLAAEGETRAALIDLENAYRALALAERSAELSRERVEMARERYRLGALGFTELQAVIDRAATAERDALDARFRYVQAVVALEARTGVEIVE